MSPRNKQTKEKLTVISVKNLTVGKTVGLSAKHYEKKFQKNNKRNKGVFLFRKIIEFIQI